MKRRLFLLFLISLILGTGAKGTAGLLPKDRKARYALIGGIAVATLFSVLLWKKFGKSDNVKKHGKRRAPVVDFVNICVRYSGDKLPYVSRPIPDNTIRTPEKIIVSFHDKPQVSKENIFYLLAYKSLMPLSESFKIVENDAENNRDKEFYLIHPLWSNCQKKDISDMLNSQSSEAEDFKTLVTNLYNCQDLPVQRDNIRFITLSDQVLSLDEVYNVLNKGGSE